MATADPRIQRWREELTIIHRDIVTLTHNRRMFREIMKIIQSNPHLPRTNVAFGWMIDGYVALATTAFRRQVDRDEGVISLARLLQQIVTSPEVITRTWFVSQYSEPAIRQADKDFDAFDPAGVGFLNPQGVREDLDQLLAAGRETQLFVNKYVAHRDKDVALGSAANPPQVTWGELDRAIDLLGHLLTDYELLLNQAALVNVEPIMQTDWQVVFRQPWIAGSDAGSSMHGDGR